MNKRDVKLLLWCIVVIFLQISLFNNINIYGKLLFYIYPVFILLAPAKWKLAFGLIGSFVLGSLIDLSFGLLGIHAAASVLLAFVRPTMLSLLYPQSKEHKGIVDHHILGLSKFYLYLVLGFFIHHLTFFILEFGGIEFGLHFFVKVLLSTLASSLVSLILVIILAPRPIKRLGRYG